MARPRLPAFALLLIVSKPAFPAALESAFQASCRVGTIAFTVEFRSPTQDATADDMVVAIAQAGQSVPVSVERAWYHKAGLSFGKESVCDWIPAFATAEGNVLLVLSADHRPNFNRTELVLYSPAKMKVLHVLENVGSVKSTEGNATYFARTQAAGSYDLHLVRVEPAETWLRITMKDLKLHVDWLKD